MAYADRERSRGVRPQHVTRFAGADVYHLVKVDPQLLRRDPERRARGFGRADLIREHGAVEVLGEAELLQELTKDRGWRDHGVGDEPHGPPNREGGQDLAGARRERWRLDERAGLEVGDELIEALARAEATTREALTHRNRYAVFGVVVAPRPMEGLGGRAPDSLSGGLRAPEVGEQRLHDPAASPDLVSRVPLFVIGE
jgi:hypothetical protein